jgi:hypothetical protein
VKLTIALEIGNRTVAEQVVTSEDFRGDFRTALSACGGRIELSTYGPPKDPQAQAFDTMLEPKPQL